MLRRNLVMHAVVIGIVAAGVVVAADSLAARADTIAITTLPRVIVRGQCPAGVPVDVWADFQKRWDTGARRAVRGGFVRHDARYLVSRLDVIATGAGNANRGTVTYSSPAARGVAYATAGWATRNDVSMFVAFRTTDGQDCGATLGSN